MIDELSRLATHPLVARLGWTLVHYIWQGAALAAVLAIALLILRRSSPNVRYLACCTVLLLTAACPLATFFFIHQNTPLVVSSNTITVQVPPLAAPPLPDNSNGSAIDVALLPDVPVAIATAPSMKSYWQAADFLPIFVLAWLIGVVVLAVWHIGGWMNAQALVRHATDSLDAAWQTQLTKLSRQLRIRANIGLRQCSQLASPAVIGWLKPVILIPAGCLAGMPPQELAAILAHELAHIRRRDYLVNLLQSVIETLLFYHPAVWWISAKVREERENCCDELAATVCGSRVLYARALTTLEELRQGNIPSTALAAAGGPLLRRIRRVLGMPIESQVNGWWAAGLLTLLLCSLLIGIARIAQGETDETPATNPTTTPATQSEDPMPKNDTTTPQIEEITGIILDPNGKPLANAPVSYTTMRGEYDKRMITFDPDRLNAETTTDAAGRFQIKALADAHTTDFWVKPEEFAVLHHAVRSQRGDLGAFRLGPGVRMEGRVLGQDGSAVDSASVSLESIERNELHQPVTFRKATADKDGRFIFPPVKPGGYELSVTGIVSPDDVKKPAGAFLPIAVTIDYPTNGDVSPIELRPEPEVRVQAQFKDSAGQPLPGMKAILFSPHKGKFYQTSGGTNATGTLTLQVPKGMEHAEMQFVLHANRVLRYRFGDSELKPVPNSGVPFQSLGHDVADLEIVQYASPVISIRAVDADGKPVNDFDPRIDYPASTLPPTNLRWNNGVKGDVYLEKQADGSWKSQRLLPDQEFTISAESGEMSGSEKMKLIEGDERQVVLTLRSP